ncbi:shikimate dehydrogenase [Actinomyces slackii]|uniref:Shikimate dehydrogenase n=1 Tax=Actinomyces slackii TaxID=52774 RepID=A0A448KEF7_9ACTO|nr:shikimate dehydrogenase [Actinomyces slackii]VEG75316.1 Shikimate dehydrogenase [Actinomyces slackii]
MAMTQDPGPGGGRLLTHRAAVIGQPVTHSLSPVLHRAAYADLGLEDWHYGTREVVPDGLAGLLADVAAPAGPGPEWAGLSVTMPHKQVIASMLDVVDPLARTVGAINTVVAQRSGRGPALLAGFNTDVAGIVQALRETRMAAAGARAGRDWGSALILGSGATACSAVAALSEVGVGSIAVAARRHAGPRRAAAAAHRMGVAIETLDWQPGRAGSDEALARRMAGCGVVVSTLPSRGADDLAGVLARQLSVRPCASGAVLLDVAYDPWPSALAAAWHAAGGAVAPGWLMLLHQAVDQVRLFTGHSPRLEPMRQALLLALQAR